MTRLSIWKDRNGTAAIEFAMLILPFSLTVFVILEIALLFFVDSALDSSLHKTAREVRVGTAQDENWDIDDFKTEMCSNMAYYFDCVDSLMITSETIDDVSSFSYTTPVTDGALTVTESFDPGDSEDFVLIQAFLPWDPVLPMFGFAPDALSDGTYILSAAVLFRNEPF